MQPSQPLMRQYADILGHDPTPAMVHVVGLVDALSKEHRVAEPPPSLNRQIYALGQALHPRSGATADVSIPQPEARFRSVDHGPRTISRQPEEMIRRSTSHTWGRTALEMAAAGVAFVVVAAVLIAVFGRANGESSPVGLDTPPTETASLTVTIEGAHPVFDVDAGARQAYLAGRGQHLDLVQHADGFTITLRWAFHTGTDLFIYYLITGPSDRVFNSFNLVGGAFTDTDGTALAPAGGSSTAVEGTTSHHLIQYVAPQRETQSEFLTLRWTVAAIQAVEPMDRATPVAPTPPIMTDPATPQHVVQSVTSIADGTESMSQSDCRDGDVCTVTIPGPFVFEFTVWLDEPA